MPLPGKTNYYLSDARGDLRDLVVGVRPGVPGGRREVRKRPVLDAEARRNGPRSLHVSPWTDFSRCPCSHTYPLPVDIVDTKKAPRPGLSDWIHGDWSHPPTHGI